MGALFGSKPPPTPVPLKPLPTRDSPEIAAKAEKQRLAFANAKGSPGTVKTTPLGAVDEPNIKRKSLLGVPT